MDGWRFLFPSFLHFFLFFDLMHWKGGWKGDWGREGKSEEGGEEERGEKRREEKKRGVNRTSGIGAGYRSGRLRWRDWFMVGGLLNTKAYGSACSHCQWLLF